MPSRDALPAALERMLEPLVQLLVRNGVSHGAFAEIAKRAYVRVAAEEERIAGRKQTASRMSVLTGLTRKEIGRLLKEKGAPAGDTVAQHHRAARVITGWIRDERFLDEDGQPRVLALDGEGATFAALVKAHSGDVPYRAMLDELLRVGAAVRDEEGRVRLVARAYVPHAGEAEKLENLGTDVAGLISTIRHNLSAEAEGSWFQRKVFYDNLAAAALPALRDLASERGQALLELLDGWMAQHDADDNPDVEGPAGRRAGVGIYYFEEHHDEEGSS